MKDVLDLDEVNGGNFGDVMAQLEADDAATRTNVGDLEASIERDDAFRLATLEVSRDQPREDHGVLAKAIRFWLLVILSEVMILDGVPSRHVRPWLIHEIVFRTTEAVCLLFQLDLLFGAWALALPSESSETWQCSDKLGVFETYGMRLANCGRFCETPSTTLKSVLVGGSTMVREALVGVIVSSVTTAVLLSATAMANGSMTVRSARAFITVFKPKLCGINKKDRQAVFVERAYLGTFSESGRENFEGVTLWLSNGDVETYSVERKNVANGELFYLHVSLMPERDSINDRFFRVELDTEGRPTSVSGRTVDNFEFEAKFESIMDPESPCRIEDGGIRTFTP